MLQPNTATLLAFSDAMLTFIFINIFFYLQYARKKVLNITLNTPAQHTWAFSCKSSPIAYVWCREQFFAQKTSHRWEGSSGACGSLLGSPGMSSWWRYLEAEIWLRLPYIRALYSRVTPRQIGEYLSSHSFRFALGTSAWPKAAGYHTQLLRDPRPHHEPQQWPSCTPREHPHGMDLLFLQGTSDSLFWQEQTEIMAQGTQEIRLWQSPHQAPGLPQPAPRHGQGWSTSISQAWPFKGKKHSLSTAWCQQILKRWQRCCFAADGNP